MKHLAHGRIHYTKLTDAAGYIRDDEIPLRGGKPPFLAGCMPGTYAVIFTFMAGVDTARTE